MKNPDKMSERELRAEVKSRRWISVEDRLPETGQVVLVWPRGDSFPIRWRKKSGEWFFDALPVTHWMPLPEPPVKE